MSTDTTIRTYPPGATCWVDLAHPDPAAARDFYGGLLGWAFTEAAPGDRWIATLDGSEAASITAGDGPADWHTHVAVDDLDAVLAAVEAAGGRALGQVVEVGPAGRTAGCEDPTGARFELWQPGELAGAQYVNGPGGWVFSDLRTPDRAATIAFHAEVFGWKAIELPGDGGTMLQLPGYGDHLAATSEPDIHERQAQAPEGFADVTASLAEDPGGRARWHVSFGVADRDGSVERARELGAEVVETSEDPWTRQALLRDPAGVSLSISQFAPQDW